MKERSLTIPIVIVSVAVPLAVAALILLPHAKIYPGFNTSGLPLFHAILNSTTAILLLASLYFIKHQRIRAHRAANLTAVVLSSIFLVSYVIYHSTTPSVRFGDLNHDGVLSADEKLRAGNLRQRRKVRQGAGAVTISAIGGISGPAQADFQTRCLAQSRSPGLPPVLLRRKVRDGRRNSLRHRIEQ